MYILKEGESLPWKSLYPSWKNACLFGLIPKELFGNEGIVDKGFLSEKIDSILYVDGQGIV